MPETERPWAEYMLQPNSADLENLPRLLQLLERAIEAKPEDPRPYFRLAQLVLVNQADLEVARPYIERALELGAVSEDRAIRWLLDLGRGDEGLARARRWVEREPSPMPFLALSDAIRYRGEWRGALEATRRAQDGGGILTYDYVDADAWDELEADWCAVGRPCNTRWDFLAEEGRFREALAAFDAEKPEEAGTEADLADWEYNHWQWRFNVLLTFEDPELLLKDMEWAIRRGFTFTANHSLGLALLGDVRRAERMGSA